VTSVWRTEEKRRNIDTNTETRKRKIPKYKKIVLNVINSKLNQVYEVRYLKDCNKYRKKFSILRKIPVCKIVVFEEYLSVTDTCHVVEKVRLSCAYKQHALATLPVPIGCQ
jgi:hypothetical protein